MAGLLHGVFVRNRKAGRTHRSKLCFERFESRAMLAGDSAGQPPTDIQLTASTVDENLDRGTLVGVVSAVDADDGDTFSYSLIAGEGASDNASFEIIDDQLFTAAVFDYEAQPSFTIRISATDNAGHSYEKQFTILVNDINEAPSGVDFYDVIDSLAESSDTSSRIRLAGISIADDALGSNELTLTGPNADIFEISEGSLFLKSGVELNREEQPSYSVTVIAEDATLPGSTPASGDFVVAVTEVSEDLRIHLSFDEDEGTTARDLSGRDWNGTLEGRSAWVRGVSGNAVFLDGKTGYVDLPDGVASGLTATTIALWMKLDQLTDWSRVFEFYSPADAASMSLVTYQGKLVFEMSGPNDEPSQGIQSDHPLELEEWMHVALVLTGAEGRLYINGTETGHNPEMTKTPGDMGNTTENFLGRHRITAAPAPHLDGALDDFRIYNRALSPDAIRDLAGRTVPDDISLTEIFFPEEYPSGLVIGELQTTGPDGTSPFQYELVSGDQGPDSNLFEIVGTQLRTTSVLDYEEKGEYVISVRSTDSTGKELTRPLTVYAYDIAAPENFLLSSHVSSSLASVGSVVASFSAAADSALSFSLVSGEGDADNDYFDVSNNELLIQKALPEYAESLLIRAAAEDEAGNKTERIFNLVVTPQSLEVTTVHEGFGLSGAIAATAGDDLYAGFGVATDTNQFAAAIRQAVIDDQQGGNRLFATQILHAYASYGLEDSDVSLGGVHPAVNVWVDAGYYARGIHASSVTLGGNGGTIEVNMHERGPANGAGFFYGVWGMDKATIAAGDSADRVLVDIRASRPEAFQSYGIVGSTLGLAGGDDRVVISVSNSAGTQESVAADDVTFLLGEGDDQLTVLSTGLGINASTIDAGVGDDTLDVTVNRTAVVDSRIEMGAGSDNVLLRSSGGNHPDLLRSEIYLGDGDDYIDFGTAIDGFIDGGEGFDTLRLRGNAELYSQVSQEDGSILFSRSDDALFSFRVTGFEAVMFGDLVFEPVYAGRPLSGFLSGSTSTGDWYYGTGFGSAIESLNINDAAGPDRVSATTEHPPEGYGFGAYVASSIDNSSFSFGDQDVSIESSVPIAYYSRAMYRSAVSSGDGGTTVLLSVGSSYYLAAGAESSTFQLGGGDDVIDIAVDGRFANEQVMQRGLIGSDVHMGAGNDLVRVEVVASIPFVLDSAVYGGQLDFGDGDDAFTVDVSGRGIVGSPSEPQPMSVELGEGSDFVWVSAVFTALKYGVLRLGNGDDFAMLSTSRSGEVTVEDGEIDLGSGNDELVISGGARNAVVYGGPGVDRLRVAGRSDDYSVTEEGDALRVTYLNAGDEGWLAYGFEEVVFDQDAEGFRSSAAEETAAFAIEGVAAAFEELVVVRTQDDAVGIPLDAFAVDWQWADDEASWASVGRGRGFMPSLEHVGGRLRAEVTYVDSRGVRKTVATEPTAVIQRGEKTDPTPVIVVPEPGESVLTRVDENGTVNLVGTAFTAARISGAIGDLEVLGNDFGNLLVGGGGNDTVYGGTGADLIIGGSGPGDDSYYGGLGHDVIRYTSAENGISVNLSGGVAEGEDIDIDTIVGIEDVVGGRGGDMLVGDLNDNSLWGYLGDDIIRGGAGIDNLFGNEGDDELHGQLGDDLIDGGDGQDTAVFFGARADYVVRRDGENGYTVTDGVGGRDGVDIVRNIEWLRFSDLVTDAPLDRVTEVSEGSSVTDTTSHAGDEVIVKRGAGRLILVMENAHTGGLRVEEGEVVIRHSGAVGLGGPIEIWAGARVVLEVHTDRISLNGLVLTGDAHIDIGLGGVVLPAGSYDITVIRDGILAARNSGTWDGNGIGTTHASGYESARFVGYSINSDGSLTVAWAAAGDVTLDGRLDSSDINALMMGGRFNLAEADGHWYQGDFTYDGIFDSEDMNLIEDNGLWGTGSYFPVLAGGAGFLGVGSSAGSSSSSSPASGEASSGNASSESDRKDGGSDNDRTSSRNESKAGSGNEESSSDEGADGEAARLAASRLEMGPAAPTTFPSRVVRRLVRPPNGTTLSDEATQLAFAALQHGPQLLAGADSHSNRLRLTLIRPGPEGPSG